MTPRPLPAIGAPATRALASVGIDTLDGVATLTARQLMALHGFGPRALRLLEAALAQHGLTFASESGPQSGCTP